MDTHGSQSQAGKGQGPPQQLRPPAQRRPETARGTPRDIHSQRTAPGQQGNRGITPGKGLRQENTLRRPFLRAAAERHRGCDRSQRRRQNHPFPPHHGSGTARRRSIRGRRNRESGLCRPEPPRPSAGEKRLRGDIARRRKFPHGRARRQCPRLPLAIQLHGADQEKKIGVLSGGERNRLHLPWH